MINETLRLVRVYHNVNQKTLASALGISPSYLSELESGKKQVTIALLERYATYFCIPMSSLMYFSERQNCPSGEQKPNPIAVKVLKMLDWIDTITRDTGNLNETEIST